MAFIMLSVRAQTCVNRVLHKQKSKDKPPTLVTSPHGGLKKATTGSLAKQNQHLSFPLYARSVLWATLPCVCLPLVPALHSLAAKRRPTPLYGKTKYREHLSCSISKITAAFAHSLSLAHTQMQWCSKVARELSS